MRKLLILTLISTLVLSIISCSNVPVRHVDQNTVRNEEQTQTEEVKETISESENDGDSKWYMSSRNKSDLISVKEASLPEFVFGSTKLEIDPSWDVLIEDSHSGYTSIFVTDDFELFLYYDPNPKKSFLISEKYTYNELLDVVDKRSSLSSYTSSYCLHYLKLEDDIFARVSLTYDEDIDNDIIHVHVLDGKTSNYFFLNAPNQSIKSKVEWLQEFLQAEFIDEDKDFTEQSSDDNQESTKDKPEETSTSSFSLTNNNAELTISDTWEVAGQWRLTVNEVRTTDERNRFTDKEPSEVIIIDYSYENIGYEKRDLFFIPDKVVDASGTIGSTYPVRDGDYPSGLPIGAKIDNATEAYGIKNSSDEVLIYFEKYDDNSNLQKSIFRVPVN